MPVAILIAIVTITLVVHAYRTGRFMPWGWIMLVFPVVGIAAYMVVELIPAAMRRGSGAPSRKQLGAPRDERDWRALADAVEISDTIANRAALADECLRLGYFEEALGHYESILSRATGDSPVFAVGKARAEFGAGRPKEAIATLDDLRARWSDYQSADAHLLYARALEEAGRTDEALAEYEALANYYPGAEPKVRHGVLLHTLGQRAEARAVLSAVIAAVRRQPEHVQQMQAEWVAIAERTLRA
jgi:hypothetical protein